MATIFESKETIRHLIAALLSIPFIVILLIHSVSRDLLEDEEATRANQFAMTALTYVGDASFALTGSLAAGREGMDLLGCTFVGFVTALGGGTFRDIVLGRLPIFWLKAYDEASLSVIVAMLAFFLWPRLSRRFNLSLEDEWLFWTDTLGLAVASASGALTASLLKVDPANDAVGVHFGACACCGMFTATFGGLTRDVVLGRPPRILYNHAEVYALPALLGGIACTAIVRLSDGSMAMHATILGCAVTIFARVLAVNHDLKLPSFPGDRVYSKEARPRDAAAVLAKSEDRSQLRPDLSNIDGQSGMGFGSLAAPILQDDALATPFREEASLCDAGAVLAKREDRTANETQSKGLMSSEKSRNFVGLLGRLHQVPGQAVSGKKSPGSSGQWRLGHCPADGSSNGGCSLMAPILQDDALAMPSGLCEP